MLGLAEMLDIATILKKKKKPDTRGIIDYIEFFTETPSSLENLPITNSTCKSHYTFKVPVGIRPLRAITFLFQLRGGNVSDKKLIL